MTRRLRVKRQTTIVSTSDKNKVKKLINLISDNIVVIETAQDFNKAAMKELDVLMHELHLNEFKATTGDAGYITPESRASSVIIPSSFKAKVTDEEFMECITVGKTKAKKVLSEREIEAISKSNKATKKEPVLIVTPK